MKLSTLESLAILYDRTAHELREVVTAAAGGGSSIPLHSEAMQNKVRWLGEISKTLSLVYQLEKLRAKDAEVAEGLPAEKVVEDPAMKQAKKNQPGVNQDLSQFSGWKPLGQ